LSAERETTLPGGGAWLTEATASLNSLEGDAYVFGKLSLETGAEWSFSRRRTLVSVGGTASTLLGEAPVQDMFLLGGRGTVPGYEFRSFGGGQAITGRALAAADLTHPWLRGRLSGYLGWAGSRYAETGLDLWAVPPSDGVRASVGVGVGLFYDLLHIDVVRGISRFGQTDLMVEIQSDFWGFL
jgi:outer membrane translocation and assembly module TamA